MTTRADQRKFHYIYKITRTDGKYYIGMHSTDDLEDGYFGSGQLLWKSIKKHGKEAHSKEILEFLRSRQELRAREREIVDEEIVNDPRCMNLRVGGAGWDSIEASRAATKGNQSPNRDRKEIAKKILATKQQRESGNFFGSARGFTVGYTHREETKVKLRKPKNQGQNNSAFGTKWMTDGVKPIKVPEDRVSEYFERGFRLGRK